MCRRLRPRRVILARMAEVPCAYCRDLIDGVVPEHAFPRSIGGYNLVVPTHLHCNDLANKVIDGELVKCAHVRRARALVGVRDVRTSKPYQYELRGETVRMVRVPAIASERALSDAEMLELLRTGEPYGPPGGKVVVKIGHGGKPDVTLIPNPVVDADGVHNAYCSAEKSGPTVTDGRNQVLVLVQMAAPCTHSAYAWRRFTAKAGLALLYILRHSGQTLEDGTPVERSISLPDQERLARVLRDRAFGIGHDGEGAVEWSSYPGTAPAPRHVVTLTDGDHGTVVSVRLFDFLLFNLAVEDVTLRFGTQLVVPVRPSMRAA